MTPEQGRPASTDADRHTVRHAGRNAAHSTAEEFVKRFVGADAERRIANTLAFDRWQRETDLRLSPRIRSHSGSVIRFDLIAAPRTLQDIIAEHPAGGPPPSDDVVVALRAAGALLGRLHGTPVPVRREPCAPTPRLAEAVAPFRAIPLQTYLAASAAELECWRMFHHDEELVAGLATYSAATAECPIVPVHGDLRTDQFVASGTTMYLVDWEEFDTGSAEHDVACMVGALYYDSLLHGLGGLQVAETSLLGQHTAIVDTIIRSLSDRAPLVREFLDSYRDARGAEIDTDVVGRGIGWFFITRTVARAMLSARLGAVDRAVAGVGRQAMVDPTTARDLTSASPGHGAGAPLGSVR